AVIVPLEVFTRIGKEGISLISSISSYAIGSSYVAMTIPARIVVGMLVDKYGPRILFIKQST
ncbi:MAG TPA: hypothetical protein EYP36_04515, partial [Calditrichaeota bacterium]|nr:hypothetical protein [Calditrichota bacterium]